jgi:hypothetical protein
MEHLLAATPHTTKMYLAESGFTASMVAWQAAVEGAIADFRRHD